MRAEFVRCGQAHDGLLIDVPLVAIRLTPEPEMVPLIRAIKSRIEALSSVTQSTQDKLQVYSRNGVPFLQIEIRRDHILLDLWLPPDTLEEARATGIARAHAFLGDAAVRVRFERAADLSRVGQWIERSYAFATERTISNIPTASR